MPGQSGAPGKEGLIGPKVQGLLIMDTRRVESDRSKKVITIESKKVVALGDGVADSDISGEVWGQEGCCHEKVEGEEGVMLYQGRAWVELVSWNHGRGGNRCLDHTL